MVRSPGGPSRIEDRRRPSVVALVAASLLVSSSNEPATPAAGISGPAPGAALRPGAPREKGLLVRFYKEFRAARAADPSGYETLKGVLGEQDMDAFKVRWEAFVANLTFN